MLIGQGSLLCETNAVSSLLLEMSAMRNENQQSYYHYCYYYINYSLLVCIDFTILAAGRLGTDALLTNLSITIIDCSSTSCTQSCLSTYY